MAIRGWAVETEYEKDGLKGEEWSKEILHLWVVKLVRAHTSD